MNTSESIGEISQALVMFQAKAQNPAKLHTADTGKFSYNYAALPDIIEQLRPLLAEHGLAVLQNVGSENGVVTVKTLLVHKTGEWMESDAFGLPAGSTPQNAGGAVTYGRRYSLTALLGLAADEDDDGAQASSPAPQGYAEPSYGGAASQGGGNDPDGPATQAQMRAIHKVGSDLGMDHDQLREMGGGESMTEMSFTDAAAMLATLNDHRKQARKAEKDPVVEGGPAMQEAMAEGRLT